MKTVLFATRRTLMISAAQAAVTVILSRPLWAAETLPTMTVTRDPNCDCCGGWVAHVKAAGFLVEVVETDNLAPLKARLGVPNSLLSCHTAEIDGYIVEGHVPADAIKRLLTERPQARGVAVAGMPTGSPGMEVPRTPPQAYDVILFERDSQSVFARYRGAQAI